MVPLWIMVQRMNHQWISKRISNVILSDHMTVCHFASVHFKWASTQRTVAFIYQAHVWVLLCIFVSVCICWWHIELCSYSLISRYFQCSRCDFFFLMDCCLRSQRLQTSQYQFSGLSRAHSEFSRFFETVDDILDGRDDETFQSILFWRTEIVSKFVDGLFNFCLYWLLRNSLHKT